MEICSLVRCLADHLSQLAPEELKSVEGRGLSSQDVQRQLSSHLIDQFWCCVLRQSPHCLPPRQYRAKSSRYSAAQILEDLDLTARKRVIRGPSHGDSVSDDSSSAYIHDSLECKKVYQQCDIYVDVALRLHHQVLRQKGLYLESLALELLLQLYNHISHVPDIAHFGKYVGPLRKRWLPFTCCEAVLEMLCHLSSEPLPCVASLELARPALLRKGIKEVRHIDMKVMLDSWGGSTLGDDDVLKWVSGQRSHGYPEASKRYASERWTSGVFDRVLADLPIVIPPRGFYGPTDLGMENLTISPLGALDGCRYSIHSAWLPIRATDPMDVISDNVAIAASGRGILDDVDDGLDKKAACNWLSISVLPYKVDDLGNESPISEYAAAPTDSTPECSQMRLYNFRPFEDKSGHVVSDVGKTSVFCHVDRKSTANVERYNKWQVLPSFDSTYLQGNIPHCGGLQISQDSVVEAMLGCTVRCLFNCSPFAIPSDHGPQVDWFTPVVLCLQGSESTFFESKVLCQYRKDRSFLPAHLGKLINDDIGCHLPPISHLCHAIFEDFVSSSFDPQKAVDLARPTPDGKFVKIKSAILPSQHGELRLFTDMECTDIAKGLRGYNSLRVYFAEICYVGSVMRRLKYFISLIKHLETIPHYRTMIGSTISVYAVSLDAFIYEFESEVTTFAESDFKGELHETVSVYSLFLSRIERWLEAISWFDRVTFAPEYNAESCDLFLLPRGSFFLDYVLGKYAGSYVFRSVSDTHSLRVAYRCLISTLKPYLSFLSGLLTGCHGNSMPSSEFLPDEHLLALQHLEGTIASSREFSVFLQSYYPTCMRFARSMYSRYLLDNESSNVETVGKHHDGDTATCYFDLIEDISLDLRLSYTWLNRKMIELLRSEYHIFDVMEEVYRFVFLSRADMMGSILADWHAGRYNDSYLKLFTTYVVVDACVSRSVSFRGHAIELKFSSDRFNSYIFTDEVTKCYKATFQQLCTLRFGVMNVLNAHRWLCMSFRVPDEFVNVKCKYVLRLLSVLTRDMYGVLHSVEWYMHHIVLGPLYEDFLRRLYTCDGFSELLSHHLMFVRAACSMCLSSEECGRFIALLNGFYRCSCILDAALKGLCFDIIQEKGNISTILSLEPTIRELESRFTNLKREFLFMISASRDAGPSHLATILSTAVY